MDTTVSPCDDFDRFINGGWRDRTLLPDGADHIDVFTTMGGETHALIRGILEAARQAAPTIAEATVRVIGTYYESCLQADSLSAELRIITMRGARAPEDTTRPARCQRLVMQELPDALDQVFFRTVRAPAVEAQVQRLVEAVRAAARARVEGNPWMSAEAKTRALTTLAQMTLKVAAPETKVDYTKLILSRSDVVANQQRISDYLASSDLSAPTGWRQERVFYAGSTNRINLPMFMLRLPFYALTAEPALAYAGLGASLAHEAFHGIAYHSGIVNDTAFQQRGARLGAQYAALPPMDGVAVNGQKSSTENVADLGGVLTAYDAWQKSSRAMAKPKIDGFTPEQRFFVHYARVWRMKGNRAHLAMRGSHAPGWARINGVVINVPAFAQAFGCKAGDPMVASESDRVEIW